MSFERLTQLLQAHSVLVDEETWVFLDMILLLEGAYFSRCWAVIERQAKIGHSPTQKARVRGLQSHTEIVLERCVGPRELCDLGLLQQGPGDVHRLLLGRSMWKSSLLVLD